MGNRFFNSRGDWYVSFSEKWGKPGQGKYWKKKLNKARRKKAKLECRGIRGKSNKVLESLVNYKMW